MRHKRLIILFTVFILSFIFCIPSFAEVVNKDISSYAPYCILIETSTGKAIYEKDANEKIYPASTTKIMTAILTLENCKLTDTAIVSHEAIITVPLGYSHAYLVEGEELTINQLLHLLLIPSANDAANVLAEKVAGSVESFAAMMNTKAVELGCKNTHFVNPNGIHNDDHYSSAYDLALMAKYAMQFETFREIVMKTEYTLPGTAKYPASDRYFEATNLLIVPDNSDEVGNYYYQYANGVKTGYTDPAGECIVASAKKDDKEFILAVLGAGRTANGLNEKFIDCKNLFNYAFDNYKTYNMHKENSLLKEIHISNANIFNSNLDVIVKDDITLVIKNDTIISDIKPEINISSNLEAPITKNSTIGTITYTINGNTYTSELIAGEDIAKSNLIYYILASLILLIIIFVLKKKKKSKHGKRRKQKELR